MADKVFISHRGASIRITEQGDIILSPAPGRVVRTTGITRLNNGTRPVAFRGSATTRGDQIAEGEDTVLA